MIPQHTVGSSDYAHSTMAYMNAALPDDDPRKITRWDVRMIALAAEMLPERDDELEGIARKLAALLQS